MSACEHRIIMGDDVTHWYDCGDLSRPCNACCPYCMHEKTCEEHCGKKAEANEREL